MATPEPNPLMPVGTDAFGLPSAGLPGFATWVGCFCE